MSRFRLLGLIGQVCSSADGGEVCGKPALGADETLGYYSVHWGAVKTSWGTAAVRDAGRLGEDQAPLSILDTRLALYDQADRKYQAPGKKIFLSSPPPVASADRI